LAISWKRLKNKYYRKNQRVTWHNDNFIFQRVAE
jgi:hypothetical protein